MLRSFHRFLPIAALCLATLLGGCVVVPDGGGYRHGWYGHGGWGWNHGGWHR